MKLESLNHRLFAPVSASEASSLKGGQVAPPSQVVIYANCYTLDGVLVDRDVFTD